MLVVKLLLLHISRPRAAENVCMLFRVGAHEVRSSLKKVLSRLLILLRDCMWEQLPNLEWVLVVHHVVTAAT